MPRQGISFFLSKGIIMFNSFGKRSTLLAVLLLAVAMVLGGCGTDKPSSDSLKGSWSMSQDDFRMDAVVGEKDVRITMTAAGAAGLYWSGSFPSVASSPATFVSNANTADNAGSLFGSTDSQKSFVYEDGVLSFKFEMMGVSKTIVLEKQ